MACNHPLTRIETHDGKISFQASQFADGEALKSWAKQYEQQPHIKSVKIIPCGQCIECRLQRSREWANRLMVEAKQYNFNWFVTLTYDDSYVPLNKNVNTETGELHIGMTLKKEDLQRWFHDLRQYWERKYNHTGIRYYACGEYGEQNERPHYHCIIFNLPHIDDLELYRITDTGEPLYTSKTLEKIWGRGYVVIGEVTYQSASYVARYVIKKRYGKDANDYYKSKAKLPEFTIMSTHPGIGKNYYEENKETIYMTDEIFIKNKDKVIKTKPPKYFDKLLEKENPELHKEIKRKRQKDSTRNIKNTYQKVKTVNNIQKQREIKERTTLERIKNLKREL